MANESIGKLRTCPFGLADRMEVRKKRKGSHPLYLWSAQTGPVFLNTRYGQDWILDRAVMYDQAGNDPEPEPEPEPQENADPAPDPDPEPVKESKPDSGGWFI